MTEKKAKLSEVAELAQTSVSTASLVLNGRADELRIVKETRNNVLKAAKKLGYVTPSKRKNKTKKCVAIALLSSTGMSEHEYFHDHFLYLSAALTHSNIFQLTNTGVAFKDIAEELQNGPLADADAFIFPTLEQVSEDTIKRLDAIKKPYVILNRRSHPLRHCVIIDNFQRGYDLANKMYDAGHRDIAYLKPKQESQAFEERFLGISKAASERGLFNNIHSFTRNENNAAAVEIKEFLKQHTEITAIITHSQEMSWQAIAAKKDISVAALDHHAAIATPKDKPEVSGYKTSIPDLCQQAARLVTNILRDKKVEKNTLIEVPGEFIPGDTLLPLQQR